MWAAADKVKDSTGSKNCNGDIRRTPNASRQQQIQRITVGHKKYPSHLNHQYHIKTTKLYITRQATYRKKNHQKEIFFGQNKASWSKVHCTGTQYTYIKLHVIDCRFFLIWHSEWFNLEKRKLWCNSNAAIRERDVLF